MGVVISKSHIVSNLFTVCHQARTGGDFTDTYGCPQDNEELNMSVTAYTHTHVHALALKSHDGSDMLLQGGKESPCHF